MPVFSIARLSVFLFSLFPVQIPGHGYTPQSYELHIRLLTKSMRSSMCLAKAK